MDEKERLVDGAAALGVGTGEGAVTAGADVDVRYHGLLLLLLGVLGVLGVGA